MQTALMKLSDYEDDSESVLSAITKQLHDLDLEIVIIFNERAHNPPPETEEKTVLYFIL